MRFFVDGFLEGFTGAGMFLGPRPMTPVSLLAEEAERPGTEQMFDSLHIIFDAETSLVAPALRDEIAAEIKTILRRVQVEHESPVRRGSFQ